MIETHKLSRIHPEMDDTFVHFFSSVLVDTGHPDQWEQLAESIDPDSVSTILLTSDDLHSVGNIGNFPNAKVVGLAPFEEPRFPELREEPGVKTYLDLLFENRPNFVRTVVSEGDVVQAGGLKFDAIAFPVPDRSGVLWHEPDAQISFVGALPEGRLPMWCADAGDFAIATHRLDAVPLGTIYSRVDPPNDDAAWFKKRTQRFVEHFSKTIGEKRSSDALFEFLETDFGGRPDDEIEWAAACVKYSPFF